MTMYGSLIYKMKKEIEITDIKNIQLINSITRDTLFEYNFNHNKEEEMMNSKEIITKHGRTIVVVKDGCVGVATTHIKDKFDYEFGVKLARARAEGDLSLEKKLIEEKYPSQKRVYGIKRHVLNSKELGYINFLLEPHISRYGLGEISKRTSEKLRAYLRGIWGLEKEFIGGCIEIRVNRFTLELEDFYTYVFPNPYNLPYGSTFDCHVDEETGIPYYLVDIK